MVSAVASLAAAVIPVVVIPTVITVVPLPLVVAATAAVSLADEENAASGTEAAGGHDLKLRHLDIGIAAATGIAVIKEHKYSLLSWEIDFPRQSMRDYAFVFPINFCGGFPPGRRGLRHGSRGASGPLLPQTGAFVLLASWRSLLWGSFPRKAGSMRRNHA